MGAPRPVALAGLGAALLAAGFGLGIVFSAGSPPEVRTIVVDHVSDPRPVAPVAPTVPAPAAPVEVKGSSPASDLSPADREALRAILTRIKDREIPSGTGVLSGRVKTEEGAPLAGVEITCNPERPRDPRPAVKPGTPVQDPDPVDSATAGYQWTTWRRNAKKSAVTDAAGEFRFEGVADLKHRFEAKKQGWQFRAKDQRQMYEARPGAVLEIIATPSVEVRFEVTWPGAAAPDNLQVQFRAGNGSSSGYGFNPDNPVANVKPGSYEVQAMAGTNQELKSESQTVEISAEGESPVLKFALKGRPGIQGRILFPDGEETEQVQVLSQKLLRDQKADASVFISAFDRGAGGGGGGRNRESGRYSLPDLAPGRYAVGVARGWNLPVVVVEEVEVADALVDRDIRVPPLQPGEYVALSVLGPDGSPLREYQVTSGYRTSSSSSSGGSTVALRPDGTRWVLHHNSGQKEDSEGTWWIEVNSSKYGIKRGEYRRGAQDAMTIRFDEPGRVEVRLEGYKGHTHEGRLRLSLQQQTPDGSRSGSRSRSGEDRIGDDGTQTFLQVQPGEYLVVLQLSLDRMPVTVAKVPVTVKGGKNEVPVKVPPLCTVLVVGAEGSVSVRNKEDPTFNMYARADAEGKALLDGLPEGEYEIRSGQKAQTFRVPGVTEIKL